MSSANMLKLSHLGGVKSWIVGLVPVAAGVVYAAVATGVCEPTTVPVSTRIYQCSPTKNFVVSLAASKTVLSLLGFSL